MLTDVQEIQCQIIRVAPVLLDIFSVIRDVYVTKESLVSL
jgi:hypothetical protein